MTGSSWLLRAACVRSMPSWSTVGVRVAWRAPEPAAAAWGCASLRMRVVSARTRSRFTPEAFEHAGGDAFALADEAEEQVLGADVVVAQPARFVDGELDDFLGARRQADFAQHGAVAAADDELDGRADLVELDAEVGEHLRGDAVAFADEAQQEVFRADVVVVEALRFFLGERQDAPRRSVNLSNLSAMCIPLDAATVRQRLRPPRLGPL